MVELFVDHTHTQSLNNLRWQPHWHPRLTSLPRKSRDWWRTRDSSLGQPTENKIDEKLTCFFVIFYFTKSQTSDSFVNHFDGHFAYLKTLDFSFNSTSSVHISPIQMAESAQQRACQIREELDQTENLTNDEKRLVNMQISYFIRKRTASVCLHVIVNNYRTIIWKTQ